VALTAYASEVDRRICRQAGMDDYLSKPFKSSDLQAVLGRCCGAFALEKRLIDDTDEAGSVGGMADKSGEQVFDYVNLLNRLGGRRDTIPRFLELFRNGIAHQRQELESAASSGDPEAVRVTAHAIKGAAANIAALRVYEVAARIERKSYEGLFEAAVALIPELYDELSRFENSSRELFP
jgi:HPt (histidine-containing phosphotransfer) domain-containing protein